MKRCLELALKGAGFVAPNPMVGAVLVHEDRIIGEGFHQRYGDPHAEVNCIRSVLPEHRHLIPLSTLYVSLEPCSHFGKTPPCTGLILAHQIPSVVIGCTDPFPEVNGRGVRLLREAGVEVMTDILEAECRGLNKRFIYSVTKHQPYVILKWAQTADGKMASQGAGRLHISNDFTNRLVHRWRAEESAIMVGTNTAMLDDPQLNTRLWPGPSPVRVVIDLDLRLPSTLHVFDQSVPTIVFNAFRDEAIDNLQYYQVSRDVSLVHQVLHGLQQLKIQSVLVEGGRKLLQSFIDEGAWNEARVIINEEHTAGTGLPGPVLSHAKALSSERYGSDSIHYFIPQNS